MNESNITNAVANNITGTPSLPVQPETILWAIGIVFLLFLLIAIISYVWIKMKG